MLRYARRHTIVLWFWLRQTVRKRNCAKMNNMHYCTRPRQSQRTWLIYVYMKWIFVLFIISSKSACNASARATEEKKEFLINIRMAVHDVCHRSAHNQCPLLVWSAMKIKKKGELIYNGVKRCSFYEWHNESYVSLWICNINLYIRAASQLILYRCTSSFVVWSVFQYFISLNDQSVTLIEKFSVFFNILHTHTYAAALHINQYILMH